MVSRERGRHIEWRLLHSPKAALLINESREFASNVTVASDEQPWKQRPEIVITVAGMTIAVRLEQS
jgi:hypothetical protein